MANSLSLLGRLRVPLLLGGPASFRCAVRVFGLYSLRGAEGVAAGLFAGLSCPESATGSGIFATCGYSNCTLLLEDGGNRG
jgi:hypothetical protein